MKKMIIASKKLFSPGGRFYRSGTKKLYQHIIRKKRELPASETKEPDFLSDLIKEMPVPLALLKNGLLCSVNKSFLCLFRYPLSFDLKNTPLEYLVVPESRILIKEKLSKSHRKSPWLYPAMGQKYDGTIFPAEFHFQKLPISNRKQESLLLVNIISGQKKTEEALAHSRSFIERLMKTANVMIIGFDKTNRIKYFNKEAEVITGYTLMELRAAGGMEHLIPRDLCPEFWEALENVPVTGSIPRTMVTPMIPQNGEEKIISWQNSLLDEGDIKTVCFGIDITSQKTTEEKLKEFAENQKVLLREVNHRVKNNLQSILSIIQMKAVALVDPKDAEPFLELEARIKGLATIHNMLTQSAWKPVNLDILCLNLLEDTLALIYPTTEVKVSVTRSPIRVTSSQAHNIALILNELLTNSMKYAFTEEEARMINIVLLERHSNYVIKYQDNGVGYPQDLLKGDFSHTGLGFEIIRGIVSTNLHGQLVLNNSNGAESIIFFPQ